MMHIYDKSRNGMLRGGKSRDMKYLVEQYIFDAMTRKRQKNPHLVFEEAWNQREQEAEMPIMEDLLAKLSTLAQ